MHAFRSNHLEAVCPSCRKEQNFKWKPLFWHHTHYMTAQCSCEYKMIVRTEHHSSGHY